MREINARAFPRVGLLGNPSDLYGGRGLGFTFDAFSTRVTLRESDRLRLEQSGSDLTALLRAGWDVFQRDARALSCQALDTAVGGMDDEGGFAPFSVEVVTDVPRQSGLSGSSAILVALIAALARWSGCSLPPHRVAQLAWRAENEVLGIRAGPLDRLVQAHDGFVAMDFTRPWDPRSTWRLDPARLPSLLVAWDEQPGEPSGAVHESVHARWRAGDPEVAQVVAAWPGLVDEGLAALREGDVARFARLVDRNFELRARLFPIAERDRQLVEIGRQHGAAAKQCGSGGSILYVLGEPSRAGSLARACQDAGFGVVEPNVVGPRPLPRRRLRAVVLAAGFATRLYPLTRSVSKPLLEVGGETVLGRLVGQLANTGAFVDVVVVTNGRFATDYRRWCDELDVGLPVHIVSNGVVDEADARGAIADLAFAMDEAPGPEGPVAGHLVAAGDALIDASLAPAVARFLEHGRSQLLTRRLPQPVPPERYGEITLAADGTVDVFREKPADPGSPLSPLAGYVLPADLRQLVRDYLADDQAPRDAPGWFIGWLCDRLPCEAIDVGGRWFDIGDVEQLDAARAWADGPGAPS